MLFAAPSAESSLKSFSHKNESQTVQLGAWSLFTTRTTTLTEGVRRIIAQTPFATIFESFFTGKLTVAKSNNQIGMILNAYNHEDGSFTFGSSQFEITMKDVGDILGLNVSGEYITEKDTPLSYFVTEAFRFGKTSIKKSDVAEAFARELSRKPVSVIDVQEMDQNFARLVLIDIFKVSIPQWNG